MTTPGLIDWIVISALLWLVIGLIGLFFASRFTLISHRLFPLSALISALLAALAAGDVLGVAEDDVRRCRYGDRKPDPSHDRQVDHVITCLPSPAVSEAVLAEILTTLKPGATWIEMSTPCVSGWQK